MIITTETILATDPCPSYPPERIRAIVGDGLDPADPTTLAIVLALHPEDARWVLSKLLKTADVVVWARACAERAGTYAAHGYAESADYAESAADYASRCAYATDASHYTRAARYAASYASDAASYASYASDAARYAASYASDAARGARYAAEHRQACQHALALLAGETQ